MNYYHCSPTSGLTLLEPRQPQSFRKGPGVYLTTSLPMALMYSIQNFEYTYGYTRQGQIYLDEYFPNALEILYRGRRASLYRCAPASVETTRIPNEAVSRQAVPVLEEIPIPDALEALLEQERLGALVIHRYETLSEKQLAWIRQAEMQTILEMGCLDTDSPMARYLRQHYPESWELAMQSVKK